MQKTLLLVSALCTLFCAKAQDSTTTVPKLIYTTKPLKDNIAPVIDGTVDDLSWGLVDWSGEFIERDPDENTPPSEQSKFKII